MSALQQVYAAVQHRTQMPYADFAAAFDDWQIIPIANKGAILRRGSEVHIAIDPCHQGRVWLRGIMRSYLSQVIREEGHATTKVMDDHAIGHRLARLLGFRVIAKMNGLTEYQL
jgi:hypothetical protein